MEAFATNKPKLLGLSKNFEHVTIHEPSSRFHAYEEEIEEDIRVIQQDSNQNMDFDQNWDNQIPYRDQEGSGEAGIHNKSKKSQSNDSWRREFTKNKFSNFTPFHQRGASQENRPKLSLARGAPRINLNEAFNLDGSMEDVSKQL